ncbi:maleylpyruvate isomerase family mycothiol-dependent enzyme [Streptomyces sp. KLOTTS4A1]|uniref:maleylpyruvate isomerase family mycothiol-dependent enzyme n=1 Tax=Streptomyces sp. KLOTTS4A1 TaxID=3390996 RepID=UPI0039F52186
MGNPERDRDVWPIVHAERAALIHDLEGLDDPQWEQPSLCEGWTVHDVVAHLVHSARTTRLGFVTGLARARFDFHRQNARGVARERGASPAETLARLRQVASRTSAPPAPLDSRIVEEIVHGEDIRRPLGLTRAYPRDAVIRALRLQARTPASFGGAKERVAPLRLTATDAEVSMGEGPEATGPVLSLLLAITGRRMALDDLDGEGVDVLRREDSW